MQVHFPPFTKPEAAYDSRRLYEETSAIAAAQDARLDKPDPVNAPAHYALGGREAIDVIESVAATVHDPVAAVLTSHALKYLMRWPRKGGITDLRKCQWYLERLIANVDAADCKAGQRASLRELVRESQDMRLYVNAPRDKAASDDEPGIDWNACFLTPAQLDAAATGKPPLEPSRIATPAELAYLASFGPNNNARSGHPMAAESLRLADERSPEDLP